VLEENVATPVTPNVEEAVKAPTEVKEVWKVEAPVIPIPPEVTSNAAECEATPENKEVDPNTAAPVTPNPVPIFKFPETPSPPTTTKAPFVDDVELVLEENVAAPVTPSVEEAVKAPTEVKEVWKVEAPVIPIPPEVTNTAAECEATPENKEVEPNTAAPETPSPVPAFKFPETPSPPITTKAPFVDDVELVLEENVAIPVTPSVEEAVKAPTEVNEVWNVEAPVIPIPPEVTNKAAECEATPENKEVDPNTAAPDTPKPAPAFIFPETPKPPTRVTAPLVEEVEFVFELNTASPLTVNPPVTPRPPEVTSNEVLKDFTPAKVCADVVTSPISPTLAFGILKV
jgi:hypothetical protein